MKLKITTVLGAAVLLGACQTTPEDVVAPGAQMESTTEAAPIAGSIEDFNKNVPNQVFFDFDKSHLRPDAKADLMKQADWLNKYSQVAVVIEGHCDKRGTREYNLGLGERRAHAAAKFLEASGIAKSRVKTVSLGKDGLPGGQGDDEMTHQKNRTAITKPE